MDVQQQHHAALVNEGRKKFAAHLEDHVLDYFHNNPVHIEACLATCVKIFGNVVEHPEDEKYRKVKASSNTLKTSVHLVNGGEDLLLYAGWLPKVVDCQKYWLFDAEPESVRFGVLQDALHLCEKAIHTVHEKAEKKRSEKEAKLTKEKAEKERIMRAIEEDKAERKLRAELTSPLHAAAAPPAVASPSAVSRTPGTGTGSPPADPPAAEDKGGDSDA